MRKSIKILVPVIVLLGGFIWGTKFLFSIGDNTGFAPEQPFEFNHKKHAGQYKIPCMYCHSGAYRSRASVVPSMNVCMNCHKVVATDKPKIQKLTELYQKGEAVEWTRVHDLPDFVYFNHERHIAKNVGCEECHGAIEKMTKVRQVQSLKMGWCLDCHRGKDSGGRPRNGPPRNGPTDCGDCHN